MSFAAAPRLYDAVTLTLTMFGDGNATALSLA